MCEFLPLRGSPHLSLVRFKLCSHWCLLERWVLNPTMFSCLLPWCHLHPERWSRCSVVSHQPSTPCCPGSHRPDWQASSSLCSPQSSSLSHPFLTAQSEECCQSQTTASAWQKRQCSVLDTERQNIKMNANELDTSAYPMCGRRISELGCSRSSPRATV